MIYILYHSVNMSTMTPAARISSSVSSGAVNTRWLPGRLNPMCLMTGKRSGSL